MSPDNGTIILLGDDKGADKGSAEIRNLTLTLPNPLTSVSQSVTYWLHVF